MVACAYRRGNMVITEEKWIDENVEGEEEKERMKQHARYVLSSFELLLRDCPLQALEGRDYCMFHDPEYWRENGEFLCEVFFELLKLGKIVVLVGVHLPEIVFPEVVSARLLMPLAKFHGVRASTRFERGVDFEGAVFEGEASFKGAFFREASFDRLVFKDGVSFEGALFGYSASFYEATFKGRASFEGVTLEGKLSFYGARFMDQARFNSLFFVKPETRIVFEECSFIPELVTFDNTDITRFLFLDTDIERINFGNAERGKGVLVAHELFKNPELKAGLAGFTFRGIMETYERLGRNFEKNRMFADADRFFYQGVEVRRTRKYYEALKEHLDKRRERWKWREYSEKGFRRKVGFLQDNIVFSLRRILLWLYWLYVNTVSPLALYKWFSKYGRSMSRPLLWSFAITFFLWPLLFITIEGNFSSSSYVDGLRRSITLFLHVAPIEHARPFPVLLLEAAERVMSVLLVVLTLVALKRKLERHLRDNHKVSIS